MTAACKVSASSTSNGIAAVVKVVERRTIDFLCDELKLVVKDIGRYLHNEQSVKLRDVTAIVGVGSRTGLYIAYSYDASLLHAMMVRYTAELTIAPEEEALYMRETASEVVNVIVGNCTASISSMPCKKALQSRCIPSRTTPDGDKIMGKRKSAS